MKSVPLSFARWLLVGSFALLLGATTTAPTTIKRMPIVRPPAAAIPQATPATQGAATMTPTARPGLSPSARPRIIRPPRVLGDPTWHEMGSGATGKAYALVVDANGMIYAGGDFSEVLTSTGPTKGIARWNPSAGSWEDIGGVWNNSLRTVGGKVYALAADRNGNIFVGGDFLRAGNLTTDAYSLARLNGTQWNAMGGVFAANGQQSKVHAIAITPDGQDLCIAGEFRKIGNKDAPLGVAKYNIASGAVSPVGNSTDTVVGGFASAVACDNGGDVYIAGSFTSVGGVSANGVAKWNGSGWSALSVPSVQINTLALASSDKLYAGAKASGAQAKSVAWTNVNAIAWNEIGIADNVTALAVDAAGNLYAGAGRSTSFTIDGTSSSIARWDGTKWKAVGSRLPSDPPILAIAVDDVGNIYAGGELNFGGGSEAYASGVARLGY